jgi:cytochrome o ubiquinol oxidase subunit 1
MFGKLTLDAVPYHEPIIMVTVAAILIGGAALVAALTYFGKWKYLWSEWLTSVDHKRLGIMYIIMAFVMLIRGFADAIMMRTQQVMASAVFASLYSRIIVASNLFAFQMFAH